ncbi:RNA polymerase sigma factor [Paenibacillus sp. GCM10027626]|uniref:RNA polymerase sigma factor n=1 Tax=Paenibacillus sp. GCM10027626 TaxID=3273411 RepID=UPI00363A028B
MLFIEAWKKNFRHDAVFFVPLIVLFNESCAFCGREGQAIQPQDDEWVNLVLEGDQEVYRRLIERYQGVLYSLIWGILRHSKDTEDALQETFVRIYLALPGYRGQGFKSWASRIAINIALDAKRKKKRQAEVFSEEMEAGACAGDKESPVLRGHSPPAEEEALERDKRARIRHMIETMPEGYSKAVQAFYLEQKNYQEIAAAEQIAVKSVESRLHRAKQWMRRHWKKEDLE